MTIILALIAWAGDWAVLNQDTVEILKSGRFAEAERVAKLALGATAVDGERAISQMNLSRIYRDWARCPQAARAAERGVQLFEKTGDRLVTMEAAAQLVSIFLECHALDRARAVEKRYVDLELARRALPPYRASQLIGNAGVIALQRRRYDEAEALLSEATSLGRPVDQAVLYGTLAQLYMTRKEYRRAMEHTEKSLELTKEALGLQHPLAVKTLANLSVVYAKLGEHAKADAFHEQAMVLVAAYYEPDNPLVADILENRAGMLRERDRKQEARALEDRARAIRAALPRTAANGWVSLLER